MPRLFAGVVPGEEALRHLERAVQPLQGRPGGPRWIPAERWHVTLAFYGDVAEAALPRLARELAALEGSPMTLRLAGAGTFPARRAPVVLWAGLAGNVEALERLARAARRAGRRVRVPRDAKPFSPHLTLGRWRPADAADRSVVAELASYSGPEFSVEQLILFRSHLGPNPRYERLETYDLA